MKKQYKSEASASIHQTMTKPTNKIIQTIVTEDAKMVLCEDGSVFEKHMTGKGTIFYRQKK